MAHVQRHGRMTGPVVTPLEHDIPVAWTVVGTEDWLQTAWMPGALDGIAQVVVDDPVIDLTPILECLQRMRVLGLDTETAGPYRPNDRGYSMNPLNPDTRVVLLQVGNQEQVFLVEPALIPYFKGVLESGQALHVGHNLIYDFKWLLVKYGIHVQRMYCSMLAEQILTAGLMGMRVNLADSVRRRKPYWIINKALRDLFIHLDHVKGCPDCHPGRNRRLTREMGYYAARDITLLFPLMREQLMELKHWQLDRVAQVEFDIIPATAEMETEGVDLYLPVMRLLIEGWSQKERELSEEFFKLYFAALKQAGKEKETLLGNLNFGFNLKSNAAKLQALRELDIDLDNVQRSTLTNAARGVVEKKSGKKKVEMKLDVTADERRMLEIFAEFSEAAKYTTTYGRNMVEKISPVTGRWHPRFKQLGSGEEEGRKSGGEDKATIATGRFSSDAQQFPKPKDVFVRVVNPKELQQVLAYFASTIETVKAVEIAKQTGAA